MVSENGSRINRLIFSLKERSGFYVDSVVGHCLSSSHSRDREEMLGILEQFMLQKISQNLGGNACGGRQFN